MTVRILLRIAGEVIPHRRTHTGIGAVLGWCSSGLGNYCSKRIKAISRPKRAGREKIQVFAPARTYIYFVLRPCNQEQYFVTNARGDRKSVQDISHVG